MIVLSTNYHLCFFYILYQSMFARFWIRSSTLLSLFCLLVSRAGIILSYVYDCCLYLCLFSTFMSVLRPCVDLICLRLGSASNDLIASFAFGYSDAPARCTYSQQRLLGWSHLARRVRRSKAAMRGTQSAPRVPLGEAKIGRKGCHAGVP